MANLILLQQEEGNRLCRKLIDTFCLKDSYVFVNYNVTSNSIELNMEDYEFYYLSNEVSSVTYIPFNYENVPLIFYY